MKKKIEAELVSLAHRLLKINNYSDTVKLHEDVKRLYEQLTLLRFYEENLELITNEFQEGDFEEKLEKVIVGTIEIDEEELEEETILVEEEIIPDSVEIEEPLAVVPASNSVEEDVDDEEVESVLTSPENIEKIEQFIESIPITHQVPSEVIPLNTEEVIEIEEPKLEAFQKETAILGTTVSKQVAIDDLFNGSYEEPLFVKKEDVQISEEIKEETEIAKTTIENSVEEQPIETIESVQVDTPKPVGKSIVLGLNDKIAFEKNLFAGNSDDLNRVLSQLNTFTSFEEAKSFVVDFVKPDYNNWTGKEEFESRFIELVENKFK